MWEVYYVNVTIQTPLVYSTNEDVFQNMSIYEINNRLVNSVYDSSMQKDLRRSARGIDIDDGDINRDDGDMDGSSFSWVVICDTWNVTQCMNLSIYYVMFIDIY
jgi:hypothetical protein